MFYQYQQTCVPAEVLHVIGGEYLVETSFPPQLFCNMILKIATCSSLRVLNNYVWIEKSQK